MNNKFFLNSIGIATIIFAVAFLIRSVQPANALPKPNDFVAEGTNDNGRYRVQFSEGMDNGLPYFYGCVSDTQTGRSSVYVWSKLDNAWKEFFAGNGAIPNIIR